MNGKKNVILAVFCLLCASCLPVGAASADASPARPEPALPAVQSRTGVAAQTAAAGEGEEADKKDKKKPISNGKVLTKEEIGAMDIAVPNVLHAGDFHVGGIHCGDSLRKVRSLYGSPTKYARSAHYTTMQYDGKDIAMRVRSRNDTADILKETGEEREGVRVGVESVFLTNGKDAVFGRGLRLKMPAEVLVRQMGIPSNVLRDADANIYYFVYENPARDGAMIFAVANRKIERVALMPTRLPYSRGEALPAQNKWSERDFTLMGFSLNQPFQANKYNMWNNLVKRDSNNFWLYGDYGVEVDRRNIVQKVFLLTNNAYTSRGATLGYHISTVLSLYGRPDRVEVGPEEEKSVDAYYYDSPFQKGISLVFVVNHASRYVEDVLLISAPIQNLQDPMARYGLQS